jgi:hypothetical protein
MSAASRIVSTLFSGIVNRLEISLLFETSIETNLDAPEDVAEKVSAATGGGSGQKNLAIRAATARRSGPSERFSIPRIWAKIKTTYFFSTV